MLIILGLCHSLSHCPFLLLIVMDLLDDNHRLQYAQFPRSLSSSAVLTLVLHINEGVYVQYSPEL
jgi:hypothetical protein